MSTREITAADFGQELANALQSAQPKIQKMCEEESDDQEAVAKLFEINDSIHRTIERYKLIKKGDVDGASKIPQGTLGTSTGVSKTADNELSLIDFSGDPEPAASASDNANGSREQSGASLQDDLLGLSVQDQDYGQGGGIALGFGANSSNRSFSSAIRICTNLTSQRRTRTITSIINHTGQLRQGFCAEYNYSTTASSFTCQTKLRPFQICNRLSSFITSEYTCTTHSSPIAASCTIPTTLY